MALCAARHEVQPGASQVLGLRLVTEDMEAVSVLGCSPLEMTESADVSPNHSNRTVEPQVRALPLPRVPGLRETERFPPIGLILWQLPLRRSGYFALGPHVVPQRAETCADPRWSGEATDPGELLGANPGGQNLVGWRRVPHVRWEQVNNNRSSSRRSPSTSTVSLA